MIQTQHLQLIPVAQVHKEALARGRSELAALLRVALPEQWPQFAQAFALPQKEPLEANPVPSAWGGYFFTHTEGRVLLGNGGFKGPPNAAGEVEIGYEIAPEHARRGFATEAARGLIAFAFAHNQVRAVTATTLGRRNPSNSVLLKAGMHFVAETDDANLDKLWRWRINRDAYRSD
jgi:[ribosomal protein S5]-alanine N-acetyltransferase